jgi:membrane associated rhomboid family serine protease
MIRSPFSRRGEFLGLTWGIVFLHVATFVLAMSSGVRAGELLAWYPGALELGHWWAPFTWQFLSGSAMSLFFNVLALYFLGLALEHEWGTMTYAVFYLCGVFGAWGAAALVGVTLSGSVFLGVSFLITYAFLWPDVEFLVFFVLPVKVKWLAWIAAGGVLLTALRLGLLGGLVWAAGMFGGVLFYLLAIRPRRRPIAAAVDRIRQVALEGVEARVEARNRDFFRRVEALRPPEGTVDGAEVSPDLEKLRADLAAAVNPEIRICKPVDFKGDGDQVCLRCEGFAECSLRYLGGEPARIEKKNDQGGGFTPPAS